MLLRRRDQLYSLLSVRPGLSRMGVGGRADVCADDGNLPLGNLGIGKT